MSFRIMRGRKQRFAAGRRAVERCDVYIYMDCRAVITSQITVYARQEVPVLANGLHYTG